MSELTIDQLERITAADSGRDYARERREDRETMAMLDELEDLDAERAGDHVEEALAAWKDDFGRPIEGFESPRFTTPRQREYIRWIYSEAGDRTRQNVHPVLEDRLKRGTWPAEHR